MKLLKYGLIVSGRNIEVVPCSVASSLRLTYKLLKNVELYLWIQSNQIPAILLTDGWCHWIRHQIRDKTEANIQIPVCVFGITQWTWSWSITLKIDKSCLWRHIFLCLNVCTQRCRDSAKCALQLFSKW